VSTPELFQFHFSHFNEKARWALDYKGVPHVRHSLLPGPHFLRIVPLTGHSKLPVLRIEREVIAGSARIIDHLEKQHPQPPLYPASPAERERALEIQRWFDEELGARIRQALFYELLPEGSYFTALCCQGRGALTQRAYRALYPATRALMTFDMKIGAETAARGRERVYEALDLIAKNAGPEGYLVGDRFSVADLTAASLLLLAVFPPELQFRLPEPRIEAVNHWLAHWKDHPSTAWIREIYRRHRGSSTEVSA
jgi:glutathione S-transferase